MNTEFLSIVASLLNVASMAAYFRQLRRSESIPNPATWLIWAVFTLVNFLTYFAATHNDIWISLLSLVNTSRFSTTVPDFRMYFA